MTVKADGTPVLNTQERISIAQCLNLAVERAGEENYTSDRKEYFKSVKTLTKLFHKVKTELEQEYCLNNNTFPEEITEKKEQVKLGGELLGFGKND